MGNVSNRSLNRRFLDDFDTQTKCGGEGVAVTAVSQRRFAHRLQSVDVNGMYSAGALARDSCRLDASGQSARIEWQECTLGGSRPWFLCPECGRRAGKLYELDGAYACRICHHVVYRSQYRSPGERAADRARRLRSRLGASPQLWSPIGEKPPRMHLSTFRRLRQQIHEAEEQFLDWIEEVNRQQTHDALLLEKRITHVQQLVADLMARWHEVDGGS